MTFRRNRAWANSKRLHPIKWRWTLTEDNLLKNLVKRHGPGNWDFISDHFIGRSGKSCRLRWMNQLNPKVDKTPFSEQECQRLFDLHGQYGNRWSIIVSHFSGRTDNQVKNQYHLLVRNRNKKAQRCLSSTTTTTTTTTTRRNRNSTTRMIPSSFSSVFGVYCSSPNQGMTSHEDSIISDASSGFQSQQRLEGDYQFIDFMGVGKF